MASIWQKKFKKKFLQIFFSKFNNFSQIYIIQLLQFKVADLVNANRGLQRRMNKATTTQSYDSSGQEEVSLILNNISPVSRNKTLKRMSSTPGMTPVMKQTITYIYKLENS